MGMQITVKDKNDAVKAEAARQGTGRTGMEG